MIDNFSWPVPVSNVLFVINFLSFIHSFSNITLEQRKSKLLGTFDAASSGCSLVVCGLAWSPDLILFDEDDDLSQLLPVFPIGWA